MLTSSRFLFIVLLALTGLGIAHASLISDTSAIANPQVVDFNQFITLIQTLGPVDVGQGVTLSGDCSDCTWFGLGQQTVSMGGDAGNGNWDGSSPGTNGEQRGGFIQVNGTFAEIYFAFNQPVSSAAILFNQNATSTMDIYALGQFGNVLESWTVAPSDLSGLDAASKINVGTWAGIDRGQNDMYTFVVSGSRGLGLDNLTFNGTGSGANLTDAPEPASAALVGCGALLLALGIKRRA
jgi:hypothetical protein